MQFLKECDILKIEDILPFFEDVVTIDQFKVSSHIHYVYSSIATLPLSL